MSQTKKTLIAFSTSWGTKFGGINSFNTDLLDAFAIATHNFANTVCVVLAASPEEEAVAGDLGIILVPLGLGGQKNFSAALEGAAWMALTEKLAQHSITFDPAQVVWLGHDRITGAVALAAAKQRGGRSALIHHMSFAHYEAFAENSQLADDKEKEQKSLFRQADLVLAVGPLLRDALVDIVGREVVMMVPGMPAIASGHAPRVFTGFLSGRLNDSTRKVKQAYLGVAAFCTAVHKADAGSGMPECLRGAKGPKLALRGVDFEDSAGHYDPEAETALKLFAESYAKRALVPRALPYTTDRNELFETLGGASVALMPSWHEGFGLVAWEAIAAGVPLIISEQSGVHQLLGELDAGQYTALYRVIDVGGSSVAPFFQDADLDKLADQIIAVASEADKAKAKANQLRSQLAPKFTWANCAREFARVLGWEDVATPVPPNDAVDATGAHGPAQQLPADALLRLPQGHWRTGCGMSESQLLRAEEAIVPFDPARVPFLDEQMAWGRDGSYPLKVRLFTGAGGMGKTRMALELCLRLKSENWQVGFLGGDYDVSRAGKLGAGISALNQACCVVLDYAETRQEVLLALLEALIAKPSPMPVRIVLLARDQGDWWRKLPGKNQHCEAFLAGYAVSGPIALPALHDSLAARQQAYQLALACFASQLGRIAPRHTPNLEQDWFADPLYVQMAALMALNGERTQAAHALPDMLVYHEQRYWRNAVACFVGHNIEQQAVLLMTLATLVNGIAGERDIEKVWLAAGGEKGLLKPLFKTLAALYPGEAGLAGLHPDLLGEALVAQTILGSEGLMVLGAVLGQSNQHLRHASLTALARVLRWRDDVAPVIEDALVKYFTVCALDLIFVCIQTPSPLAKSMERVFGRLAEKDKSQVVGVLRHQFGDSKDHVASLNELALLVLQKAVSEAEKKLQKPSVEAKHNYAQVSMVLGIHYSLRDKVADAVFIMEPAIAVLQALVSAKHAQYKEELAAAIGIYGSCLYKTGRDDEALLAFKHGLTIWQKLEKGKPGQFDAGLGQAMARYAFGLTVLGRIGEALHAIQAVWQFYQKLCESKQGSFLVRHRKIITWTF